MQYLKIINNADDMTGEKSINATHIKADVVYTPYADDGDELVSIAPGEPTCKIVVQCSVHECISQHYAQTALFDDVAKLLSSRNTMQSMGSNGCMSNIMQKQKQHQQIE